MVSFSHDPCERPLNLITQMPGSRNGDGRGRIGTNSGSWNGNGDSHNGSAGTGLLTASTVRGQRQIVDAEGWQTVGKRK
jgi:hypothetical protein